MDPDDSVPAATAVVTGASGTLGAALVSALLARGMHVVAVSRSGARGAAVAADPSPLAAAAAEPSHVTTAAAGPSRVTAVAADLGSDDAAVRIRAALPDAPVVIAVHAIGLPGSPGVMDVAPGQLARAVDLKAGGLLRLLSGVRDRLGPGSRVVAVGGHLGAEPTEHAPLAGVANAALANLVRQLTGPIGRLGATVHLVAPGPFDSPRLDALIEAKATGGGRPVEVVRRELLASYPGGRLPTAGEVAGVVVGLLDPSAAALHGSTLFCDGGIRRAIF